jgi:hypothetical protein
LPLLVYWPAPGHDLSRREWLMRTPTMGRKKRSEADSPRRVTAFAIKGSMPWRAWVEKGARHCRTDVSKLIDAALIDYLKAKGFEEPAPER